MENKLLFNRIKDNISKIFLGKDAEVEKLLIALFAGGHVLLEDVPGVGKTSLSESLAKTINASFKRIQFTPDTTPSDIVGFNMYNSDTKKFEYVKGAVLNNIILADELNRTSPKTQAALLEAMQEEKITVDGETHQIPKPFILIATQNTNEQFGTYPLPESQLDRFMLSLKLGYPEKDVAKQIISGFTKREELTSVVEIEELLSVQQEVSNVHISDNICEYIVNIAQRTRENDFFKYGISTRATILISQAAKARAFIDGRDYVVPDDVKRLLNDLIKHRLVLSRKGVQNHKQVSEIVDEIVKRVPVPTAAGSKDD